MLATASNLPVDELATPVDAVVEVATPTHTGDLHQPSPLDGTLPACTGAALGTTATDSQALSQQVNHLTQFAASLIAC